MAPGNVPDLDPGRESWVFLAIETTSIDSADGPFSREITSWAVGYGNCRRIVRLVEYGDQHPEASAIAALGGELSSHQDEDNLLVTPDEETLKILRSNLFKRHTEQESVEDGQIETSALRPTLHGYRHLALKETLNQYFDVPRQSRYTPNEGIDESYLDSNMSGCSPYWMWKVTRTMVPLIPIDVGYGSLL